MVQFSPTVERSLGMHPCTEWVIVLAATLGYTSVTLALDEATQVLEAIFPLGLHGVPNPTVEPFETHRPVAANPPPTSGTSLRIYPGSEQEVVLDVATRNAGVAFSLGKPAKVPKALLPLGVHGVPDPNGERLEASGPLRTELALGVEHSLNADPLPESVSLLHMTPRHESMAFALDEATQVVESVLPFLGKRVPSPSRQCSDLGDPVSEKLPLGVESPLLAHPPAQPVVSFNVARWNAGVTLAFHEALEQSEPELPTRRRLNHEMHIEGIDEVRADASREIEVDLLWHPKTLLSSTEFTA